MSIFGFPFFIDFYQQIYVMSGDFDSKKISL